jgi:hypothetical protein
VATLSVSRHLTDQTVVGKARNISATCRYGTMITTPQAGSQGCHHQTAHTTPDQGTGVAAQSLPCFQEGLRVCIVHSNGVSPSAILTRATKLGRLVNSLAILLAISAWVSCCFDCALYSGVGVVSNWRAISCPSSPETRKTMRFAAVREASRFLLSSCLRYW